MPKISLIIPVYNVEKYLHKCLDSAISQTLQEIEIIIINDGSTDHSLKICNFYAAKDKRITIYSQKNSGLGIARNKAINLAKGEFITFLDSDDWLHKKTLEESYKKALKTNSKIVIFGFNRISEQNGEILQSRDDLNFNIDKINHNDFFRKVIACELKHMACAMIVKRSLYLKYRLQFPSVLHEDLYVIPQLFFYAKKVTFIQDNYYQWLVRSGSITTTISSKHIDGIIAAIFNTKIFLLKENLFNLYRIEFSQFSLTYLNLMFRRILSYINDPLLQSKLIHELMNKSISLLDFNDIQQVPDLKLKKFQGFLDTYNANLKPNIESNTCNIISHKAMQTQLKEIKNSRGYKLLLKGYKLQNKLLPLHSPQREILKKILGKDLKRIQKKNQNKNQNKKFFDVVFLPHKDYHVWTMGLIANDLKKHGISSCMLDLTNYYRDEGSRKKSKEFPNIPFLDFGLLKDNLLNYNVLICMNDWDKRCVQPEIIKAKKANKITIGIVEGIQDFLDLDTQQNRKTYQTVEYVFLTGQHDQQFFKKNINKTYIIGVPRLQPLLQEKSYKPTKELAVINMNFSYNVLTDKAEDWLKSAIKGCEKYGIEYIITQHPADLTDLSNYNVTHLNMYEIIRKSSIVISRFSSTILEALALDKPVIYHNPHNEKAIKFQDSLNAYSVTTNSEELSKAINYELSIKQGYRERANDFLHYHCNINSKKSSIDLSINSLLSILRQHKKENK